MEEKMRNEKTYRRNSLLAAAILGFFLAIFISSFFKRPQITSPKALETKIEVKAVEVTPTPKPFCKDPISCIRDIGEEQGRSDKQITTMIRIASKEAMCNTKWKNAKTCVPNNGVEGLGVDPYAKNPKSSARGLFQIVAGTWYSNDCVGDKYNYKDNIICAYKILDGQGLTAWEVCINGSAKCW
jgi:hypothetical protein